MANRDVWVLLEAEDKKIKGTSIALIDEGKRLSIQLGGKLHAMMFGQKGEGIEQIVGAHGADQLHVLYQETPSQYWSNICEKSLIEHLPKNKAFLFLAVASSFGSNLMPRVAAQLKAPLVTNCLEIKVQENIEFIKPVQNGRLHATVICRTGQTQMATVNPSVLTTPEGKRGTENCRGIGNQNNGRTISGPDLG